VNRTIPKAVIRRLVLEGASAPLLSPLLKRATRSGRIPDRIWRKIPVRADINVQYPQIASFRYSVSSADGIGRRLYWGGESFWEWETTEVYLRLTRRSAFVLDIGANTGIYSLISCAANPAAQVMAFEPVPRLRDKLRINIARNNWQSRCTIREEAVSDSIGHAQLHVPFQDLPTMASLNQEGYHGEKGELVDVDVTTVDEATRDWERVDLIKMDVEGFEDKVLLGTQQVLAESQPAIVLECNHDGPREALEEILGSHGYQLHHLLPGGPVAITEIEQDEKDEYRNFLALPPGKADWLDA